MMSANQCSVKTGNSVFLSGELLSSEKMPPALLYLYLVWPAHPLDGEARAPGYAALVQLRRSVHNGGHQELLEVLVGVDEQVVLPA